MWKSRECDDRSESEMFENYKPQKIEKDCISSIKFKKYRQKQFSSLAIHIQPIIIEIITMTSYDLISRHKTTFVSLTSLSFLLSECVGSVQFVHFLK